MTLSCVGTTNGKLGGPNDPLQPGLQRLIWAA